MLAFEVSLNGDKLCLAGIGNHGVLSSIVSWVARPGETGDLFLSVGGLFSPTEQHVDWVRTRYLSAGDEIRVRIVEADCVDKPSEKLATR